MPEGSGTKSRADRRKEGILEYSFTLRRDIEPHAKVIDWIESQKGSQKRFKALRDHIVDALLAQEIEPTGEQSHNGDRESERASRKEPDDMPSSAVVAAATGMDF